MQLDQVLGLAARAIQAVVDPLGRADIEARDDEADVEAQHRRLNTGDGAPFAIPGLCLVARLGVAAQNRQVLDGASRADIVGDLVDFSGEWLGAGQAEDVVDAVVLAPRHGLRPGIVPIATERNARLAPTHADMPYQAAQMGAHLVAARRLAGPQHDRHGPALVRVVDVDRQKAALVIMSVEQRELLMAVDDIAGIVDVERDDSRLARVAIHPCIDQSVGQSDHVAQARSILQARQGRLGTQIAAGVRQPSAGQLECGIGPQMIEVRSRIQAGLRTADPAAICVPSRACLGPQCCAPARGDPTDLRFRPMHRIKMLPREPASVTLDIDDTCDVVHGHQQLSLFNAHYDERCFLPIHVYDTDKSRPVAVMLRPGKTLSGNEVRARLRRLVRHIRMRWRKTRSTFRGDGHYARPEAMTWCETTASTTSRPVRHQATRQKSRRGRRRYPHATRHRELACSARLHRDADKAKSWDRDPRTVAR